MNLDKLDMTSEELETFKEALKKEEFRKLLGEYAEELRDPVKRQQYEEELTLLESQRGVDMKFIKPDPGFVIKIMDNLAQKVFINVCSSPDIGAPEFSYKERAGVDGKVEKGQQCSLPHSFSPLHEEADNKGVKCPVYDVVFHPDTLARCTNPKFKEIVVNTAVEGVCTQFQVQLDRTSQRFPKMKFKGTPAECVIRKRVSEEKEGAFNHLPKRPDFPDLPEEKKTAKEKKDKKKEEKKKPDDEPEYKIVYRSDVDMGDFTNDRVGNSSPSHVIVTICLPLHANTRDVDLDVYPDQLELHSAHYNLLLALPYTVDSDRGKAKFDKEKKELCVTLEVIAKDIPREMLDKLDQIPGPSLVEEMPDQQSTESGQNIPNPSGKDLEASATVQHNAELIEEQPSEPTQPSSKPDQPSSQPDKPVSQPDKPLSQPVKPSSQPDKPVSQPDKPLSQPDKPVSQPDKPVSKPDQQPQVSDPQASLSSCVQNKTSDTTDPSNEGSIAEPVTIDTSDPTVEPPINTLEAQLQQSQHKPQGDQEILETTKSLNDDQTNSSELNNSVRPPNITLLTDVQIELPSTAEKSDSPVTPPIVPSKNKFRFNVSPVMCSENTCVQIDKSDPCRDPIHGIFGEKDIMDDMEDGVSSLHSGLSSYTDTTLDDNLSVGVRVYQDIATATVILDAEYNSVPEVTFSGKKVWLKNEDVTLYLLLPHSITTYTIDMNHENVCLVMYKQHPSLWSALHIGHSEDEVFSFKFITEENTDRIVESLGDPWMEEVNCSITPQINTVDGKTTITYSMSNSIPIYSPDTPSTDDPMLKGILKSPRSPPPISPRSRMVSFNEEVETFVLPSKRSLKGKKRRKKKNGSNSASESSDDASSPSSNCPLQDHETEFVEPQEFTDLQLPPDSLRLDSAQESCTTKRKNGKKSKNKKEENKENVMQTREEVVTGLDPTGSVSHKLLLSNSHIYELED